MMKSRKKMGKMSRGGKNKEKKNSSKGKENKIMKRDRERKTDMMED